MGSRHARQPAVGRTARRLEATFFSVLAVAGFAAITYLYFPWRHSSDAAAVPVPATVVASAKNLSPVRVPAGFAHDSMAIPAQSITAPIDAASVVDNQLTIPSDVKRVGYFTGGGPLDGRVGDLLIAGHVNYVGQGTGALGRIGFLHIGDAVITRGDGAIQAWRVTGLASYLKTDGLPTSIFRASGSRLLTLVTCGGTLDTKAHNYLSNIVVTASPVAVILTK